MQECASPGNAMTCNVFHLLNGILNVGLIERFIPMPIPRFIWFSIMLPTLSSEDCSY